jgi:integrase
VNEYLTNAPDDYINIPIKLVLIIAIHGFLRKSEIVSIMRSDVSEVDGMVIIKVWRKKTRGPKLQSSFLITDEKYVSKVLAYIQLINHSKKPEVSHLPS